MFKEEKIHTIVSDIRLDLPTSPEELKQQIKRIILAQKQLRLLKKELTSEIRNINQQAAQANVDSLGTALLSAMGQRKLAGQARADTRRAIEKQKKLARQPYLNYQAKIDELILEGDRLKLLAEEYEVDPETALAKLQEEQSQELEPARADYLTPSQVFGVTVGTTAALGLLFLLLTGNLFSGGAWLLVLCISFFAGLLAIGVSTAK